MPTTTRARRKIVVIDDSQIALQAARATFEGAGWTVTALDSPIGASVVVGRAMPDVVLVDVAMASMSGEAVVKNIRARLGSSSPTRVLLFSDRSDGELGEAAARCGAHGYVRKTGEGDQLLVRVEQALDLP